MALQDVLTILWMIFCVGFMICLEAYGYESAWFRWGAGFLYTIVQVFIIGVPPGFEEALKKY